VRAGELPTLATEPRSDPRSNLRPASTVLGRYALKRRLGSGAFGTVWSARDERLERDVAVKILPRERVTPQRFEREARTAARLVHPAIVTLYEAAVDDDGAYIVSELVRGSTLGDLLDSGRMSDRDVVGVGLALCDALSHAHAEGVVHRDVKPSNVLVAARRSVPPAKLTDFGVARVIGGDSLTRTGDVIGTAAYMAPEQAEGREAGPPADLYSLALVLYEALTGVNPLAQAIRYGRPRRLGTYLPPIRRQRRDLPRVLAAAIDQALRPRPSERGTIDGLRQALSAALDETATEPGVIAPAKPLTLLGSRITGDDAAAFGPEWRSADTEPEPAFAAASGPPARSGRLDRLGPRAAVLLTAVTALGLGAVGLAGATPAVVGLTIRRWYGRAILAALAFAWLGAAATLTGRTLYWSTATASPRAAAIAAGIWAAGATVLPWLGRLPRAASRLVLIAAWAAAIPAGLATAGLPTPVGVPVGALAGALLASIRPLVDLIRAARLP
jgi:hypothetical protein